MSSEEIQSRIDEAVQLAIARSDVDIDETIVKFEQATERLEAARQTIGGAD